MRRLLFLAIATVISVTATPAQEYTWAAGLRIGGEMAGAALKYKINAGNAMEIILATPYDGNFIATILYERHVPVIGNGFNLYYGAGVHTGAWHRKFAFGVDAIMGLEYKLPDIPLGFSIDYKPIFNIVSDTKFRMADVALGVKIVF